MWERFEYFSGYGFNKSHAISYSAISFQCAWLYNYYPVEWMASFLDKEPEKRKELAINIAKQNDFEIVEADVNTSSFVWEIDPDNPEEALSAIERTQGIGRRCHPADC